MILSQNELNFVQAIKDISDFTISELFILVTKCTKINDEKKDYAYTVDIPNAVQIEVNLLEKIIKKFESLGLVECQPNYNPNIKTYYFCDSKSQAHDQLNNNMVCAWAVYRYYKTDDYKYFESHNFITKNEREAKKEKRRKFWHDWSPLLVSTIALLLTALPSYLNFIHKEKQEIVVEYEPNIIQIIELQRNGIEKLKL